VHVSFPEVQSLVEADRTDVQLLGPFECAVRVYKCLGQAHSNDNTGRCRESDPSIRNRRFQRLSSAIDVTYISASVKAITVVSCLGEQNMPGTSLLESTSKITTEFAYNGCSKGLHKKRYC